jgi:hypothetical protein
VLALVQARAVTHQVQAPTRALAISAYEWVGQPDRRHQVAARASSASTQASMRSILQASGARPLTFCASAISTFDELGFHPLGEQERLGRAALARRSGRWC